MLPEATDNALGDQALVDAAMKQRQPVKQAIDDIETIQAGLEVQLGRTDRRDLEHRQELHLPARQSGHARVGVRRRPTRHGFRRPPLNSLLHPDQVG